MSALRYAPPVPEIRVVANLAFDGYRRGEKLWADPVLCARYIERGYLSPIDDDDQRIVNDPVADAAAWLAGHTTAEVLAEMRAPIVPGGGFLSPDAAPPETYDVPDAFAPSPDIAPDPAWTD